MYSWPDTQHKHATCAIASPSSHFQATVFLCNAPQAHIKQSCTNKGIQSCTKTTSSMAPSCRLFTQFQFQRAAKGTQKKFVVAQKISRRPTPGSSHRARFFTIYPTATTASIRSRATQSRRVEPPPQPCCKRFKWQSESSLHAYGAQPDQPTLYYKRRRQ